MRSVYGKECAKHPELAGRRYLPSNTCIECQRELNRAGNARRKAAQQARDERLVRCLELLRELWEAHANASGYTMVDIYQRIEKELNHDHESGT